MSTFELTGHLSIEQAVQGDRNAFNSLYSCYAERIFRLVCYRVPEKADAEDITQEVFIRAWRAVGRYRIGTAPFLSWLMVIARNLVADFYRGRKNNVLLDENTPYSSGIDIEREVEVSLKQDELRRVISRLKKVKQKVLIMRFIEDRSYAEISQVLGKSEGAVRVLVCRALLDLKKEIGSHDGT
jgi:RNA polymerase sigma-70 factor, ECF subfamily